MDSENGPPDKATTEEGAAAPSAPAPQAVDTPIAQPVPRRPFSRRLFILGGFWSGLLLAVVGVAGVPLDFVFPRNVKGFGGPIPVTPDRIPAEGEDPIRIFEGRFWLANLKAGVTANGEETPGGLLALWQKCPHLGCTVPWRADFSFRGSKGWFRCPCHGSTYTKDGGVLVEGPAPRPLDIFPLKIKDDLSIVVQTGEGTSLKGNALNPSRATPYQPGNETSD